MHCSTDWPHPVAGEEEPHGSALIKQLRPLCVQETYEFDMDAGGAWAVLGLSTVHAAWYTGFLLLPAGLFLVGVAEYNLLHAGYLVQLIIYLLRSNAKLEPSIDTAIVLPAQVTCAP
jgi:hypothetical protein